jgi:hypothetical protein
MHYVQLTNWLHVLRDMGRSLHREPFSRDHAADCSHRSGNGPHLVKEMAYDSLLCQSAAALQ